MKPQYMEIDEDGDMFYYSDHEMTIRHREGGPAVLHTDGYEEWWLNDKCHRDDGPAIIHADGHKEWWLNGQWIPEVEHKLRTAKETVLTLEEIATKFGVSVKQLKITK